MWLHDNHSFIRIIFQSYTFLLFALLFMDGFVVRPNVGSDLRVHVCIFAPKYERKKNNAQNLFHKILMSFMHQANSLKNVGVCLFLADC